MPCQLVPDRKHKRAQVAMESRLPVVDWHVLSEHGLVTAQLVAQHAAVLPFVDMGALVFCLVFGACKCGTTVGAPERQLPRVHDGVLEQALRRVKELVAKLATMWEVGFL